MATDVHLVGRGAGGGKLGGRKSSYDMSGGYEYYGEDGQEWWDDESAALPGYDAMAAGSHWSYGYDDFGGDGEYENNFEIDSHSLVFILTENLEPQDFYAGLEFDEKSFLLTLQDEDIDEHMPPAWKSRPLKIHPEPAPRTERKEPPSLGGILDSASSTAAGQAGSPGSTTPAHSPVAGQNHRDALLTSHRSDTDAASAQDEASTPKSGAGDKRAASPKIVISHGQLLNLKEKMQALKQRRSITPMELPPALDKGGADDEKNGKEANSRPAKEKAPITSNCPGAHGLEMFNTPDSGWWCSVCENEHPKGTAFFGCRTCDYDECESCARAPVSTKKKKKQEKEKKVRSPSSSPQGRSTSAQSPPRSNRKDVTPRASKEVAAPEKKVQEAREDSPSDDTPLRRDTRREKRREEEETRVEKKVKAAKRGDDDRREARVERGEKRASSTKDAERETRADAREAKLAKASLRESTAKSSSAAKPRTPGAALASAVRAAAASAAGRNAQVASPASDEGSSSEEEYQAPRDAQRGKVRDSRLVPREKRQVQPEHWDPRDRQEPREVAGLKRRAPPERSAPRGASRSRSASEEPLPKKRAVTSSLVSNEDLQTRGSASSSASSLRAPARSPVGREEEAPRRASRAAPRGESSNDLLRRVLGANRMGFGGAGPAKRTVTRNAGTPSKDMSPEPARDIPTREIPTREIPTRDPPTSKGSGPSAVLRSSARDGPPGRSAPNAMAGIRKALEGVKNQERRRI